MSIASLWLPLYSATPVPAAPPTPTIDFNFFLLLSGTGASAPPPPVVSAGFDFDLQSYLVASLGKPVFPVHVPQQVNPAVEVLPCYTFELIDDEHFNRLSGPLGLVEADYQVDVWSYLFDDLVVMGEALRLKLHGFKGTMGVSTVQSCNLHNRISQDEPPVNGTDKWTFHRVHVFKIFYLESIPTYP